MWFANLRRAGVLCYIRTSFLSPLICLPSHTGKKNNWKNCKESLSIYRYKKQNTMYNKMFNWL